MADPKDYATIGYIGPRTRAVNAKDAALGKDREAYREMRRQGLQPGHVKGSHALARDATLEVEVEMGHVFKTKTGKALADEGVDRCYEIGLKGPK